MKIILDTEPLIMLLLFRAYVVSEEKQKQDKIKKFLEQQLHGDIKDQGEYFEFFERELKNRNILVTSYVLAEVTDIIENHYFKGKDYCELMEASADFFKKLYEEYIEKDTIIDMMIEKKDKHVEAGKESKYFIEFGFADISVYLALTKEIEKNKKNKYNINVFLLSEDKYLKNFCTYVEKFNNVMTFNEFVYQMKLRSELYIK